MMVPPGGTLPSAVADRSQHIPRAWAKDQGEYADGVTDTADLYRLARSNVIDL